ncbi:hypothetical protein AB0C77_02475 [Streptomyces sp. NPDC048629]|uniref:hypothetical protein n=1 Tax=Streptomyces sp. NPDC048629 TaxID=3154824 RepID=UPI00342CE3A5
MTGYLVGGVLIALTAALAVGGAVELLTGWIHPWERPNVIRPVPHGIGLLLVGSGLCRPASVVTFAPTGDTLPLLLAAGAVPFLAGTGLVVVSRVPA